MLSFHNQVNVLSGCTKVFEPREASVSRLRWWWSEVSRFESHRSTFGRTSSTTRFFQNENAFPWLATQLTRLVPEPNLNQWCVGSADYC